LFALGIEAEILFLRWQSASGKKIAAHSPTLPVCLLSALQRQGNAQIVIVVTSIIIECGVLLYGNSVFIFWACPCLQHSRFTSSIKFSRVALSPAQGAWLYRSRLVQRMSGIFNFNKSLS